MDQNNEPEILSRRIQLIQGSRREDRLLVVGAKYLYLFQGSTEKRCRHIGEVSAFIKSTVVPQIVIVVPVGKDWHIEGLSENDTELLQGAIQARFLNMHPTKTMRVYEVPQQCLREYCVLGRMQDDYVVSLPDDEYRCRDQEFSQTVQPAAGRQDLTAQRQEDTYLDLLLPPQTQSLLQEETKEHQIITSNQVAVGDNDVQGLLMTDIGLQGSSLLLRRQSSKPNVNLADFKVVRKLGQGTYGKVFLAQLLCDNNREFAIKAIRKDRMLDENDEDQKLLELLKNERDVLMAIDHPFLCGVDYVFQNECRVYFVLPYFPGGELKQVLDRKGRLSEDQARFYIAQIILGVGYLHDRNIMHRDLKTKNVVI